MKDVIYFSNGDDIETFAQNARLVDSNFKYHNMGFCSVDKLHYVVIHTMPKRKPSALIKSTYDRLVRKERRFQNIYLGD